MLDSSRTFSGEAIRSLIQIVAPYEVLDHRIHHLGTSLSRRADQSLQIGQHQIVQAMLEVCVRDARLFLEDPVLHVDDDQRRPPGLDRLTARERPIRYPAC